MLGNRDSLKSPQSTSTMAARSVGYHAPRAGNAVASYQITFPENISQFAPAGENETKSSPRRGIIRGRSLTEFQKRTNKSEESPSQPITSPRRNTNKQLSKSTSKDTKEEENSPAAVLPKFASFLATSSEHVFSSKKHSTSKSKTSSPAKTPAGSAPPSKPTSPSPAQPSKVLANSQLQSLPEKPAGLSPKALQIIEECKKSGKKYMDPEFPPANSSLYTDPTSPPDWPKITEWKRVTDMFAKPQLFVEGCEAGDVIQGVLGDCWFLGALSVIATRSDLLMKCVPQETISEWGVYEFRFYKDGEWKSVIIDDFIPLNKGRPVFSSCHDMNEVWVMLMEKAYAKLHKCYENLEGGSELYAMVDLTGGAPETIELDTAESRQDIENGRMWEKMRKYQSLGYLMGCAALVVSGEAEADTGQGILQNHAYALLDLKELPGGVRLMRIRNPWGQGEWKGAWSDGSPQWSPDVLSALNYSFADDGTFWMDFKDFVQQYNRLYFLRLFGNDWTNTTIKGEWKGVTAGGCGNFPTWKNNPQYGFTLQKQEELFITLIQKDVRIEGQIESDINIGFMLLKSPETKKATRITASSVVGQTVFNTSREISKKFHLEAGNYIISPTTFHPNKETSFWLRVYLHNTRPLEIRELGEENQPSQVSMVLGHTEEVKSAHTTHDKQPPKPSTPQPIKSHSPHSSPFQTPRESRDTGFTNSQSVFSPTQSVDQVHKSLSSMLNLSATSLPQNRSSDLFGRTTPEIFSPIKRAVSILASAEYSFAISQYEYQRPSSKSPEDQQRIETLKEALKENEVLATAALSNGKSRDEAAHSYKMATLCEQADELESAISYYNRFLAVAKENGDALAEALAYNHLGIDFQYLGGEKNILLAVELHNRHDQLTKDLASRFIANCNLGICYSSLGDFITATTHFRQALGFAVQTNDYEAQSLVCDYLALSAIKQKEFAVAKVYLERRLKILEGLGDHQGVAKVHQQLGELLMEWRGVFEQDAKQHFSKAQKFGVDPHSSFSASDDFMKNNNNNNNSPRVINLKDLAIPLELVQGEHVHSGIQRPSSPDTESEFSSYSFAINTFESRLKQKGESTNTTNHVSDIPSDHHRQIDPEVEDELNLAAYIDKKIASKKVDRS